jgi:ABC-type multidrug transport system ATPase subunit
MLFRILQAVSAAPAKIVELTTVSRLYGTFAALRNIDISFEQGRCYVLLGENGAGKSTLLRTIAGLLRPTFGTVTVFGKRPTEQRDRIGYMSHSPMLYDELTGLENLSYFRSLYRTRPCLAPEEAMRATGLDPTLPRPISQYSQGMRQRASLARVLMPQPDLLLLDEPFSNMDAASALQMLSLLAGLRAQGRTIILTTHQRDLAAPLADDFVTMQSGSVISVDRQVGATA